jgi:CHAT domain-containing protein
MVMVILLLIFVPLFVGQIPYKNILPLASFIFLLHSAFDRVRTITFLRKSEFSTSIVIGDVHLPELVKPDPMAGAALPVASLLFYSALFLFPLLVADENPLTLIRFFGLLPCTAIMIAASFSVLHSGISVLFSRTPERWNLAFYFIMSCWATSVRIGYVLGVWAFGYFILRFAFGTWSATLATLLPILVFLTMHRRARSLFFPSKAVTMVSAIAVFLACLEGTQSFRIQDKLATAESLMQSGDYKEAIAQSEAAMQQILTYDRLWGRLPMLGTWTGNLRKSALTIQARALVSMGIPLEEGDSLLSIGRSVRVGWFATRDEIEMHLVQVQYYTYLGNAVAAQRSLKAAREAARRMLNRPYWTAVVDLHEARMEIRHGNYHEALRLLERVRRIGQRVGSYELLRGEFDARGDVLLSQQRFKEARRIYEEGLVLARKHRARGDEAIYLLKIGITEEGTRAFDAAMEHLSEAVSIARQIHASEVLWQGLYERGLIFEQQGKIGEAITDYRRTIEVIEAIRGSLQGQQERARYLAGKLPVYEQLVLLSHRSGKEEESFEYAQRGKARAFLDLVGTRMLRYREEDRLLGDKERELQWKIHALLERIGEEEAKPQRLQSRKLAEWRRELEQAQKEHQQVLARIRATNPQLASLVTVSTAKVTDVQKVLRPDEVLLEYFVTDEKTLLWALSRSQFRCFEIPVGRQRLSELVKRVRDSITPQRGYHVPTAHELYRLLLQPALAEFGRKPHLVIAPHDVLYTLPFEALVVETNRPTYVGDRWVVSEYESASVLVLNRTHRIKPERRGTSLFALGDPVFDQSDERYVASRAEATRQVQMAAMPQEWGALLRRVTLDDSAKQVGYQPWRRLPATGVEVNQIAALFTSAGGADVRLGMQASEEEVKRADHSRYRYEHYATHGALAGDVPNLKEPALVLSLPGETSSEDGYLTMTEVFGLRLNADMVALSACNTRMGEAVPGEGLVGLTRAFFYAGTPSVVASLWSVADESTAKLMVSFYRHLRAGKSKAEALALAKRELSRIPQYSHPFYWAPFVLVGER